MAVTVSRFSLGLILLLYLFFPHFSSLIPLWSKVFLINDNILEQHVSKSNLFGHAHEVSIKIIVVVVFFLQRENAQRLNEKNYELLK